MAKPATHSDRRLPLKPLRRALLAGLCLAVLPAGAGCSATWYRRDADRQVYDLLDERKQLVLGYGPQTVAGPEIGTSELIPPRPAYAQIPETRRPPPIDPPLRPADSLRDVQELGPPAPSGDAQTPAQALLLKLGDAQNRYLDGLRLGPATPDDFRDGVPTLQLGLFDGIRTAVAFNRGYRGQMESLYLSALGVTQQRHLFRPRPFANVGVDYNRDANDGDYDSALVTRASAGVRQQLPYGGDVTASVVGRFVDVLDGNAQNAESADVVISGSIPLLRGFGLVNLEGLISSERQLVYEVRSFERFRRQFAVQAAQRYFNLQTQKAALRNRYLRYVSALQLLDRSINFFEAGLLSALEVQRAQQQVLGAEDSLNNAEQSYANSLDGYKLFLGIDVATPLEIVDVDLAVPTPPEETARIVETALAYRLDLQTARDRVLDAQRGVDNARNGLLPDLDLNASGSVGSDPGAAASRFDGDDLGFQAGLTLELPLDRLAERNQLRRALIGLDRAVRSVDELEDNVIVDVRQALRGLESSQTTLRIQRENIGVAIERLQLANEQLQRGLSTDSRDVVEAQNALLNAQDSFEAAQADYQIAVLNLLLASGTLRVQPDAGTLGYAMWRDAPTAPDARGTPRDDPEPAG